MAKGVSIKFKSYEETIPKLLSALKLQNEIKKYDKIVLKPALFPEVESSTPKEFTESVLKFCFEHKNPIAEVFIAEGGDGISTDELFESQGYKKLAETYGVNLIDLNNTDTQEISSNDFLRFSEISYPSILKESFVISMPKAVEHEETGISSSLSSMLGAFPSSHYSGFFSSTKNKIRKWPLKFSIHDIVKCKMPELALIDASHHGFILAGQPLEADKHAAKLLGKNWRNVAHLKLIDDLHTKTEEKERTEQKTISNSKIITKERFI